jgi:hypothetical protein
VSHLSLVHVFYAIPHTRLSMGGLYTIPMNISRGMVEYRQTTTIIELRQFTGPHKSSMRSVHNQMFLQGSTTNDPPSTQAGATTLELRISTYHSLSFPSKDAPLSPSCSPGLKFKSSFHSLLNFNHFHSIRGKKGPTCEWNQPLVFYCLAMRDRIRRPEGGG